MKCIPLILLSCSVIGCQPKQPEYVVVRGVGSVTVPIDFVIIGITLTSRDKVLQDSYSRNQETALKMFDVFKSFGIADTDFVTLESETRSEETFGFRGMGGAASSKYFAVYSGLLTLRRIQIYDDLVRSLLKLGDVEISLRQMNSNDMDGYKRKAYQKAVENATEHAQQLVSGSSRRLGKILKLLQDNQDPYRTYDDLEEPRKVHESALRARTTIEIAESPPKGPITFKRKDFQQSGSVTVIFELE